MPTSPFCTPLISACLCTHMPTASLPSPDNCIHISNAHLASERHPRQCGHSLSWLLHEPTIICPLSPAVFCSCQHCHGKCHPWPTAGTFTHRSTALVYPLQHSCFCMHLHSHANCSCLASPDTCIHISNDCLACAGICTDGNTAFWHKQAPALTYTMLHSALCMHLHSHACSLPLAHCPTLAIVHT